MSLDGIEEAVIDVGRVTGLFRGGDVLAQAIKGRSDAQILKRLRCVYDLVQSDAGDKTGGHAAAHGRPFGKISKGGIARKGNKNGAQNRHIDLEWNELLILAYR